MKKSLWILFIVPLLLSSCKFGIGGGFLTGSSPTPTSTLTSTPTVTLTSTPTATQTATPTATSTPTLTLTPTLKPAAVCLPNGQLTCQDLTVPNLTGGQCTLSVCYDSCNNVSSSTSLGCGG